MILLSLPSTITNFIIQMKHATLNDILHINKIIRKLKSNESILQFKNLGSKVKIVAYTDAAFANLPDGGSQGSYLIFLVGDDGFCSLVSWQSKRIRRIVRSALAAESLAM